MNHRIFYLISVFLFNCNLLEASADSTRYHFQGYLKNMQSVILPGDDLVLMENLIHNRLNFRITFGDDIRIFAEARNRLFSGNLTTLNPLLSQQLKEISDDWLPLSLVLKQGGGYLIHSTIDRLYIEWRVDKWNFTAGRQRINWGMNLAFNPNDLFNAYNFLDFDYEERPGSDALRVQHYYDFASGFDIVLKGGRDLKSSGTAARWFFNQNEYDFQILAGYVFGDIAAGLGWSGYI